MRKLIDMANHFAEVNNTRFYYEIAGEGHPVVLVHAGIADSRMWDDQFAVFAQHYKVLRYDRRGFGATPMVAGAYSHHQDLYALLKHLDFERAYFIGCSQGAKTVVDFTLEHPEMAGALVLVSPSLSGFAFEGEPPRQIQQLEEAENAGDLDLVNELEMQIWVDGRYRTKEQVDPLVRARVGEMNLIALKTPEGLGDEQELFPPAADRLAEITSPALVITGDLDTPRTLAGADFIVEHVAGAQKASLTGCAHMPNMEKVEAFDQLVLSFLANQG
jgi:3-oxoadipate enol-lactonase